MLVTVRIGMTVGGDVLARPLAVVGTEADVERQLRSYADIGVTAVYPVGPDEAASVRRTRELLSRL